MSNERYQEECAKRSLKMLGYWISEYEPNLPDPEEYIDFDIDPELREKVVKFLDEGTINERFRGFSRCRICGKMNGTYDKIHSGYVYPDGLSHYVLDHGVRLPKSFEEFVMGCPVEYGIEYGFDFSRTEKQTEKIRRNMRNQVRKNLGLPEGS